jgi:GNAT superfamily N-acetyltransferase
VTTNRTEPRCPTDSSVQNPSFKIHQTRPNLRRVKIIDVDPDDPRLTTDILRVLVQLRPHLTADTLRSIYVEGHPQGLRFTAASADDDPCAAVAVAGWRVVANTHTGRKLYVEDLVTDEAYRGCGFGALLLRNLTERAKAAGCSVIDLDSGVQRAAAHRFYMREGMIISSFHFVRQVT